MTQEKKYPISSDSLYDSVCSTRTQAIAQRWQAVIVFIAVQSLVINILSGIATSQDQHKVHIVLLVLIAGAAFTYFWLKLVKRSNRWINFYTDQLVEIEQVSGTESGITIFSNPKYPSINLGKGEIRSSSGIVTLIWIVLGFYILAILVCVGYIIYWWR
jgi:hypothetical protein